MPWAKLTQPTHDHPAADFADKSRYLTPPVRRHGRPADLAAELQRAAKQRGLAGRRLAEEVAARLELPRRRVYQAYLELKGRKKLP